MCNATLTPARLSPPRHVQPLTTESGLVSVGAVITRTVDSPVIQLSSRDPSHGKPDGGSTTGPKAQPKVGQSHVKQAASSVGKFLLDHCTS